MNILNLHDNLKNVFDAAVAIMQKSEGVVCPGNNPSLSLAVQETYGWPDIFVKFTFDNKMVACATANEVRKGSWFSLPHFNHGGLWVDPLWWHKQNMNANPENVGEAHQIFYKLLIQVIEKTSITDQSYRCFKVELSMDDLSEITLNKHVESKIKFGCRSKFKLLDYHQEGKVIPNLLLQPSVEEQMNIFTVGVRRKIRKSYRNEIEVKTGGSELLGDFMKVYDHNIRALNSFGLPKKFFQSLLRSYAYGSAIVVVAYHNQKAVGASILLTFLDYAENPWFATINDYNHLYVSYALHHQMISESIKAGCRIYSFGRSTRDSSVHHYKKQWGTSDESLFVNSTNDDLRIGNRSVFLLNLVKLIPDSLARRMDMQVSRHIF